MGIRCILGDSLVFPFSNVLIFVCLAVLSLVSGLGVVLGVLSGDYVYFNLGIFGLFFLFLEHGFFVRIFKVSFAEYCDVDLSYNLRVLLVDGFKACLLGFLFAIPVIPFVILGVGDNVSLFGVLAYLFLIFPLLGLSLAHMTYTGKLEKGLDFGGIFSKIGRVGYSNFVLWYLVTVLVFSVLMGLGFGLALIFMFFSVKVVGVLVFSLLLFPFVFMFLYRSSALFYMLNGQGYLVCDECEGYYELSFGESVDDFSDTCECGGRLSFVDNLKQVNEQDDKIHGLMSFFNKRNMVIVGLIVLVVVSFLSVEVEVSANTTLLGVYNMDNIEDSIGYAIVDVPSGTTSIKIEYEL